MKPRILTALPVYNEESHVVDVLSKVRLHCEHVLAVDDGSSDGTANLLAEIDGIYTVSHEVNRGYGAALVSAFEFAVRENFDVLVTIDCDGQHQPRMIPELAERLISTSADMISGSRYLEIFDGQSLPPEDRRKINVEITRWLNESQGFKLTDAFCGFKAYKVSSLADLKITDSGYAMPLELWIQAAALKWNIVEHAVPLIYLEEERSFGGSLDDGKKRMAYYMQVLEAAVVAVGQPAEGCSK